MVRIKKLTGVCFIFLLILLSPAVVSYLFGQNTQKVQYVCPPCGHDCLKTVFEKAGACGECGMKLVDLNEVTSRQPMAQPVDADRKKVAILLFEGVQIIDYTGPWEVFGQAGFDVYTVAREPEIIPTTFGMKVKPDYTLDKCPVPDILVVPGGNVLSTQKDPAIRKWIKKRAETAEIVLSVCNGAFILAKAGLLEGLSATTTRGLIDGLAVAAPGITVVRDRRFVDNGKIITSGGLSAGIDAALHVVSRIHGMDRAKRIACGLEYHWGAE